MDFLFARKVTRAEAGGSRAVTDKDNMEKTVYFLVYFSYPGLYFYEI